METSTIVITNLSSLEIYERNPNVLLSPCPIYDKHHCSTVQWVSFNSFYCISYLSVHHSIFYFLKFAFCPGWCNSVDWIECWPWTKGSPVWFPVRAHAWAVGHVPSWGHVRDNHTLMFLSLSFSLPSPLSKNKYFLKISFSSAYNWVQCRKL